MTLNIPGWILALIIDETKRVIKEIPTCITVFIIWLQRNQQKDEARGWKGVKEGGIGWKGVEGGGGWLALECHHTIWSMLSNQPAPSYHFAKKACHHFHPTRPRLSVTPSRSSATCNLSTSHLFATILIQRLADSSSAFHIAYLSNLSNSWAQFRRHKNAAHWSVVRKSAQMAEKTAEGRKMSQLGAKNLRLG